MRTVKVPSGIGDVSWMYSKLRFAEPMKWEIADGWPYRTKQFLDMLPGVVDSQYGNFTYTDIVSFEEAVGINGQPWADLRFEEMFLEANRHLEEGKRLELWLPDLPTDFHYEIPTSQTDKDRAEALLLDFPRPLWGVSAASYRGSEAWKTWGYEEWSEFLKRFHSEAGGTIILLGGFWDDLTHTLSSDGYPDLVGKTSVGCAIEILKRLSGYVGFSSGLGVLGTVLRRKVFMLWPEHQQPLSTSWAPPEMIEDGSYVATRWLEPQVVARLAHGWLGV